MRKGSHRHKEMRFRMTRVWRGNKDDSKFDHRRDLARARENRSVAPLQRVRRKHDARHKEIELGMVLNMNYGGKSFNGAVALVPDLLQSVLSGILSATKFVDLEIDLSVVYEVRDTRCVAKGAPLTP